MNIFHKRPLCLILSVMLGGFVLFERGSSVTRKLLIISSLILFFIGFLITLIYKRRCALLKVLSVLLLFSVLLSYLYFDKWFDVAENYEGEVSVEGKISEIDDSSSSSTTLTVNVSSLNQKKHTNGYKIILRISKDDALYVYTGALVSFKADLEPIESSEDFDSKAYYYSDGISATANKYSDFKVSAPEKEGLIDKLAYLKENISRYSMLTMGYEPGSLFSAVFMGERSYLSERLSLDFMRTGISHILALSGMHLAVLSMGITKLLTLLGLGKKPRTFIIMLFVVFYVALTGFSVSVVRAGLMLIISSLLYLLSSTKDLPTNLVLAVFIICSVTPYAIFDVSLWLSAFATLGIICMSELVGNKIKCKNLILRFLLWIGASFAASFFAISATLAICTTFTSVTSLLGALATLIFSLLIEIFIYTGLIILALSPVLPFGKAVMTPLYTAIDKTADFLSSPNFVVVSTDERIIRLFIGIFTALFFAFIIFKVKFIKTASAVLVLSFLFVHGAAAYVTYNDAFREEILYSSDEKHDMFTLKSDRKCAVIDICSYTESKAYDTVDFLTEQSIFTLDMYVASHYSFGLDDAAHRILKQIKTKKFFIPKPKNKDEETIYSLVKTYTDKFNTELVTFEENEEIKIGAYSFSQAYRVTYGEGTMKNAFTIFSPKMKIAYLGSGMLEYLTRNQALEMIANSDRVVFGTHGKSYKPIYRFDKIFPNIKTLIVGENDTFTVTPRAEEFYNYNGTVLIKDTKSVVIN